MRRRGILWVSLLFAVACVPQDEIFQTSGSLSFSPSSVRFDTIFTSLGSMSERVWVFNASSKGLRLRSIELEGGAGSDYTITVNGQEGTSFPNVELLGDDSLLVLVKVTIDPTAATTPFLVTDSLRFVTDGGVQYVPLTAYGQNANFLNDSTLGCAAVWNDPIPYVIEGTIEVPTGCSLTIGTGTRVFCAPGAELLVNGTLIVNGTPGDSVTFTSDNNFNGSGSAYGHWKGIRFGMTSQNSTISWALVENAVNGLWIEQGTIDSTAFELVADHLVVRYCEEVGIRVTSGDVVLTNSLLAACVENLLRGEVGGNYHLQHVTAANYGFDFLRQGPGIFLSNTDGVSTGALQVRLQNSIVYGSRTEEWTVVSPTTAVLQNSLLRTLSAPTGTALLVNQDPLYESPFVLNFRLRTGSPAISAGDPAFSLSPDLDGQTRDASPEMGGFED